MESFNQNDLIHNVIISYPSYKIDMYNNNMWLNSFSSEGTTLSSSVNIDSENSSAYFKRYFCSSSVSGTPNLEYSDNKLLPYLNSLHSSMQFYSTKSKYYNQNYYLNNNTAFYPTSSYNLLRLSSLIYGTKVEPGSINLEFYFTGSLISSAKDLKKNGEIISDFGITSGSVVGIAFYSEGFILLTSSVSLSSEQEYYYMPTSSAGIAIRDYPKWVYFGGFKNVINNSVYNLDSSSFSMSYKGINKTPTITMFAHLPKNQFLWSNSPTFLTGNIIYNNKGSYFKESEQNSIYPTNGNIANYSSSFEPQLDVSKVIILDKDKIPIALCSLSKNTLKRKKDSYSIKMKFDF